MRTGLLHTAHKKAAEGACLSLRWWNTNNPAEPVQTQTFKEGITNLGRSTEDLLTLCAGKSMHVIDLNECVVKLAREPGSMWRPRAIRMS